MTAELDKVNKALSHWRGNRTNQGRIPKLLKQQIISLTNQHKPEDLAEYLDIQLNTLKGWLTSPTEEMNFISLPLISEQTKPIGVDHSALCLTVELINGVKLRLSRQTSSELLEFTCDFVKRLTA